MSTECFVIKKEIFERTLTQEAVQGKRQLEPLKSLAAEHGLPINVLEDTDVANDAEIHKHEGDLWQCLEGEVIFVYGGEMVDPWVHKSSDGSENPNELKAKEIRNGTEVILKPGDWLWIPPGQPHQHRASGTARLVIIKIPKK